MARRAPARAIVQEPVEEEEEEKPEYVTASTAKSAEFKLNDKDLAALVCRRVPNPHYRSAAPMRLYIRSVIQATIGPTPVSWYSAVAVRSVMSWLHPLYMSGRCPRLATCERWDGLVARLGSSC